MQLLAIPVAFSLVVILSAVWAELSVAAIALGAFVLLLIFLVTSLLLSYVWRVEEDEGVHEARLEARPQIAKPAGIQPISASELPTVTATPIEEHPTVPWD